MTLLNTKEVAERLGISIVRVRQLIREGKIEAQNMGRDYAISADALANVVVYRKPGRPSAKKSAKKAKKGSAK
ncbi:MAG TPA: helix-turn-helix domain-containing protein [Blastocatellia bacterium]|jgi:excisionase family DNA binding protein|nr:helix-turn-helix domain-containing protein [Blastocatellia bacterium]